MPNEPLGADDGELVLSMFSIHTQVRSPGITAPAVSSLRYLPEELPALLFTVQPTDVIVGLILAPITVQFADQAGDPIAIAGVPVTLRLSNTYQNLGGTLTQLTNASGIATFDDLTIAEMGSTDIIAEALELISSTSAEFEVTPINIALVTQTISNSEVDRLRVYLETFDLVGTVDILDTVNLSTIDFSAYHCVFAIRTEDSLVIAEDFDEFVLQLGIPAILCEASAVSGTGRNTVASRLGYHNAVEITSGSTLLRRTASIVTLAHPITSGLALGDYEIVPSGTCLQGRLDEAPVFLGTSLVTSDGVVATDNPGLIAVEAELHTNPARVVANYVACPTSIESWSAATLTLLERSVLWAVGLL